MLADGADYGLNLMARLEVAELGTIPGGTLYPALLRLETTGLVTSERRTSESGPPRKYFALTAAGRRALRERRTEWIAFGARIDALLAISKGAT